MGERGHRPPGPVAERGPTDLEQGGDQEGGGVNGRLARPEREVDEERPEQCSRQVDPAGDEWERSQARESPGAGDHQRRPDQQPPPRQQQRRPRARQGEEVNEAVAGRDVQGHIVEAVSIEPDDKREVELATGGDADRQPDLAALHGRGEPGGQDQHPERDQAQKRLLPDVRNARVGVEADRRVGQHEELVAVGLEAAEPDHARKITGAARATPV